MFSIPDRRSVFIALATVLVAIVLSGCETTRRAFEGDPMPPEQVANFLQVVSPKGSYDEPPRFVRGFAPFFPEGEGRKRKLGYALAEFTVTADGSAKSIRIIKATTDNFAQEAGYTVRDWRFAPGKKNGQPVAVRVRLPFTFRQS
ncbi:MAG: energy transducer TonB [Chthoniobacterales bacterium]